VFKTRPAAHWVEEANARTIPIAPVNDLAQVFAHPQVQHLGSVHEVAHPEAGTLRLVRSPIRVEGDSRPGSGGDSGGSEAEPAPLLYRRPPPLGEHSREILAEAGYTPEEIDGFIRAGTGIAREQSAAAPGTPEGTAFAHPGRHPRKETPPPVGRGVGGPVTSGVGPAPVRPAEWPRAPASRPPGW